MALREVGSTFYAVEAKQQQRTRPCPVCLGSKCVTVILGSGEHVQIACDYCARGYLGSTGEEVFYEWAADVVKGVVDGFEYRDGETRYHVRLSECCGARYDAADCFDTEADARARCAEVVARREAEQAEAFARKEKVSRSYAWHVGYHRREAERARKQVEYHEAKVVAMRSKSKGGAA